MTACLCVLQTQRALEAVECDQKTVEAVLSQTLRTWPGRRDEITFDQFVVLYAEVWYWTVVGVGEEGGRGKGLVETYLRGGLLKLTGGFIATATTSSFITPLFSRKFSGCIKFFYCSAKNFNTVPIILLVLPARLVVVVTPTLLPPSPSHSITPPPHLLM